METETKSQLDQNLIRIRDGIAQATHASAIYLLSAPTWNHPDHELLVVTDDPRPEDEIRVSIRHQLRGSGIPMLLTVVKSEIFEREKAIVNTVSHDAARLGISLYD